MSFYINNCSNKRPSCINPNQLQNICEKVLIEATRVFDACINRIDSDQIVLTLTDFTPAGPTFPLTFVSVTNNPNLPVVINSTSIDRSDCRPNFANVTINFTIPLIVNYIDSTGTAGTATSSITLTRSALLCVPQDSLTPITIRVQAYFSSTIGTFTSETTLSATYCLQVIIKVVGDVDLLVPTFGYPCLPVCQGGSDVTCEALFNTPIYPPSS